MSGDLPYLEGNLRVAGGLLLGLAVLNLFLPRRFSWGRGNWARLSLLDARQVFIVHCAFIILMLVMMGILSLGFAPLLVERTPLAKVVLAGLAIFWVTRLGVQLFGYSATLWRGNRFNTAMHILFSCLWLYFSVVFGAGFWLSVR